MDQDATFSKMKLARGRQSFISFSSHDEKRARAICEEMERRLVKCWISSRDVRPGRNYQSEIIEAIRNASHMVLILSDNANRSGEVARELSLASKNKVPICPVRIKDVLPTGALEFMLATSQWVDAFDDWKDAMDRLAAEISGLPRPAPKVRPQKHRRFPLPALLAAGAVAALVLLAFVTQIVGRHQSTSAKWIIAPPQVHVANAAEVERFAATLECARVVVGSSGPEDVSLSGYVKSAEDEGRLLAVANGLQIHNDLAVLPYPFCAVHELAPALHASGDIAIDINHPDGRYVIGDSVSGTFTPGGAGKLWIAADLIGFDDSVYHVLPAQGYSRVVKAGDPVPFGAARKKPGYLEATDPPGPMILLVVSSDKPLPLPPHASETAQDYLPRLKGDLAKLGASLSIATYDLTIEQAKR